MKHTILAIETATHACSVALMKEGKITSRFQFAPKEHVQLIFPMIDSLLLEANATLGEITAIAVGRGPGSFTGVRIAVSIAQGLGYGLNIPVYGVSTLEALSLQAKAHAKEVNTLLIPALDARMQEVYTAAFVTQENEIKSVSTERVCLPQAIFSENDLLDISHEIIAIGSGWDVYIDDIKKTHPTLPIQFLPECHPHAEHIAMIAMSQIERGEKGVLAHQALPVYIRDDVAKKSTVA